MRTTRLRVVLRDVEPTVSRTLDVPATATLSELHDLLQAALGWTDSHLHRFVADGVDYQLPDPDAMIEAVDERGASLRELPALFGYDYDFGDGWEHDVEVVGAGADRPGCVDGAGACPPEDCGGPGGHQRLLEATAAPELPGNAELVAWVGEPRPFDLAAADLLVQQIAGRVPESVRIVLELAADGITLTPGGRLPRAVVRAVQEVRPQWAFDERPAAREESLLPLIALHDVVREVGLLRLSKGVLRPTRASADDAEVVRRLRSWFGPPDAFGAIVAAAAVGTVAAGPTVGREELVDAVTALLGPGWVVSGERVDRALVGSMLSRLTNALLGLDLLDGGWRDCTAGPSARWLLPRATLMAHHRADAAAQPTGHRSGSRVTP
jgi:hypothetical protein